MAEETNPIIKQQLRPKINEYLDMAEKMKKEVDNAMHELRKSNSLN